MKLRDGIQDAIVQHGRWKQHLKEAIETGKSAFTVDQAKVDDQCSFGKWLKSPEVMGVADSAHFIKVRDLHRRFHAAAASALALALTGKKAEAKVATGVDSEFMRLAVELTTAMMDWARAGE